MNVCMNVYMYICICECMYLPLCWASKLKSLAIKERFGAIKFWSANKNNTVIAHSVVIYFLLDIMIAQWWLYVYQEYTILWPSFVLCLLACLHGCLHGCLLGWSVGWLLARLVVRSPSRLNEWTGAFWQVYLYIYISICVLAQSSKVYVR